MCLHSAMQWLTIFMLRIFTARWESKAFTLQHGFYQFIETKKLRPENIAFEGFISDLMLVWGLSTVAEGAKLSIPQERFLVCGRFDKFEPASLTKIDKSLCFYMNSPVNQQQNQMVLDILAAMTDSHGLKVFLKAHPNETSKNIEMSIFR